MFIIFNYDFMLRAFAAGLIIAVIAPLIGTFLVVRRYSLLADTLSHVSLVGVALGIVLGINPLFGALAISLVAAVGMEKLRETGKILGESILALFLSSSLAIAVIIIGLNSGLNVNFMSYLFGSITTVSQTDVGLIGLIGLICLVSVIYFYRQFFLISYDEEFAQANGLPTHNYNLVLVILSALTVSVAIRIIGILLIGALMVIPVLSAMQWGKSFRRTLFLGIFFSLLSVFIGLFLSFYLGLASGGAIVLTSLFFFLLSLALNK